MKAAWRAALAALSLSLVCTPAVQAQPVDPYDALRAQDLRLATIAEGMQAANAPLCRETMPLTGMILHSSDQYGSPSPQAFANGPVAVSAVVPASVAADAGIMTGDGLIAIDGTPIDALPQEDEGPQRNKAFWRIAQSDGPLRLTFRRAGVDREVTLNPPRGCRALVELLAEEGRSARSDGRVIQVTYGMADALADPELAVVFAHELGHAVLLHRKRLEAAGVKKGLLGEFGRNRRLNQQVEIEADRISAHLLHNAGYDAGTLPAFWASEAGDVAGGGMLRSFVYPSRQRRAEIVQQEVDYLAQVEGISVPEYLLAQRDLPFAD